MEFASPQGSQHLIEEIGILEITEQTEVDQQTGCHKPFPLQRRLGAVHDVSQPEVGYRYSTQQKEINTAALIIEIIREQCDEQQTGRCPFLQKHIDKAESQKEQQKYSAAENHRLPGS